MVRPHIRTLVPIQSEEEGSFVGKDPLVTGSASLRLRSPLTHLCPGHHPTDRSQLFRVFAHRSLGRATSTSLYSVERGSVEKQLDTDSMLIISLVGSALPRPGHTQYETERRKPRRANRYFSVTPGLELCTAASKNDGYKI